MIGIVSGEVVNVAPVETLWKATLALAPARLYLKCGTRKRLSTNERGVPRVCNSTMIMKPTYSVYAIQQLLHIHTPSETDPLLCAKLRADAACASSCKGVYRGSMRQSPGYSRLGPLATSFEDQVTCECPIAATPEVSI